MVSRTAFLFIAVGLMGTACRAGAQEQDPLKIRFIEEAPKKWREYRNACRRLQGERKTRIIGPGDGDIRESDEFKQNQMSCLLVEDLTSRWNKRTRESKSVFVQNSQYSARLDWNRKTNAWVLTKLVFGPNKGQYSEKKSLVDAVHELLSPHFFFVSDSMWLDDLVGHPRFEVIAVTGEARADYGRLVKVQFKYDKAESNYTRSYVGWMRFDPEAFWHVVKSELQEFVDNRPIATVHLENEVNKGTGHLPIIRCAKYRRELVSHKPSGTREAVLDFAIEEKEIGDEREFTISKFGLPEPNGVKWQTGPRLHLWLASAGFAIVVAAFLLHRVARKKKSVSPS